MSMIVRSSVRRSFVATIVGAVALVPFFVAASAEAQLPAVTAYGARLALPLITTPGKISRDAAGNIYVLVPATPAIYEIPINGPVQQIIPKTDVTMATTPSAMTVDAAGNIYVGQVQKIYEIPRNANGTYGTSVQIATNLLAITGGYYQVNDIAVDSNHNIFIINGYGIVEINSSIASPAGTQSRYILGVQGTAASPFPKSIAVDSTGNLFYVDGTNAEEYTLASLQGSTTPTAVAIGASSTSVCAGCSVLTTPTTIFPDIQGNLYIGNGVNQTGLFYIIPNTGSTFSTSSPTYALPSATANPYGPIVSSSTFGAVANNGDLYFRYGGSLELYGAGKFYVGTASISNPINVGTVSATSYASPSGGFFFSQTVTLGTSGSYPYAIVNAGSANGGVGPAQTSLNGGSTYSTCTAGHTYTAGQFCTVEVGYSPKDPGSFSGALVLYGCPSNATGTCNSGFTSSGVLATITLTSLATGSAVTIDTGATATLGTGYLAPAGIAIDNTGAAYVADPGSNAVYKYAAGTTTASTSLVAGLSEPTGTALDPAGNLYIADTGNDRVVVIPNIQTTGLSTASQFNLATPGYSLTSPSGVAVDSFGNIFISDTDNGRVLSVANPFSGAVGTIPTVVASGLSAPYGIALDPYNNLFIADTGASKVYEVPTQMLTNTTTVNVGSGNLVAIGSGFSSPTGVATDGSGTLYIADSGNKRIVKIPAESGVLTVADQSVLYSNLNKPFGIATDLTADLYYTDQLAPMVAFVKRSAPSGSNATTLNFGTTAIGSTGSFTALVANSGLTTSLTFGATAVTSPATPFSQTSNGCANSSTLLPGKFCSIVLGYTPTATGNSTGTFTITDNALAVTTATQLISLTGNATGAVATLALSGPASIVYGDTATFTVTAKDSSGNIVSMPSGTAYTLTITGGAGSSSPYAGTYNSSGTFILPTLGASSVPYSLTVTVNSTTSSPAFALTIGKAPLYLTANNISRPFDIANPALTTSYSGFANGDTASVVSGAGPTISTTATRVSPYGNYPITLSGGSLTATNYTITLINGNFAVAGSVPQTILFPALPAATHGTTVTLTGQSTSGLPLTYTVTGGTISGTTLTIGAAGTVTVTANQFGNSTYAAATSVVRTFTAQ